MHPRIFTVVKSFDEARTSAPKPRAEIDPKVIMAMKLPKIPAIEIMNPYFILFLIVKITAGPGMAVIVIASVI
jgi:hypothetical protein